MRERHTIKEKIKSVHSCTLVCDIIITSKKNIGKRLPDGISDALYIRHLAQRTMVAKCLILCNFVYCTMHKKQRYFLCII